MTDEERARHPLAGEIRTSCMNSIDLIEYFGDTMGIPMERLTEGLRVDADFLTNPANWLDNHDAYMLYRNCNHNAKPFAHHEWYRVGQAIHANNAGGYFAILLKLLSTDTVFKRIPAFIAHTSRVSEYRLLHASRGHVRLRYAIPDREVALNYTIGSECWYHLGVLSGLTKLQSRESPYAVASQEICSMPIGHILESCYDLHPPDIEYTEQGVVVLGELLARWIRLAQDRESPDTYLPDYEIAGRSRANALLVVRDFEFQGARAFSPGEIYDAPHCLFDIRYENQSLVRRLIGLRRLGAHYYQEQLRRTEEMYAELYRTRHEQERLAQTLRTIVGDPLVVPREQEATAGDSLELTKREREIAERVALGMSNLDIAEDLYISKETVKRHLYNVYAKCGVKNRVQLARRLSGQSGFPNGTEQSPDSATTAKNPRDNSA